MAKKATAIRQAMNKTQIVKSISDDTGLTRKQVSAVFDELGVLIERHIKKGAAGSFILPGMMKIKTVKRPARPARKNVPNPFKPGELMNVPARPASTRVKVTALSKLKAMVG